MRKFFSQKNKHKFYPGTTSLTMSLVPLNKDEEKQIDDSTSNRIEINNDNGEKLKKLFVVVSDVDEASIPLPSTPTTDCRLLSVDACESNESIPFISIRQRSSTCSTQNFIRYREQNPKKIIEERLRRRSWIACQSNHCPLTDITLTNQSTPNYLRLRRFRLGQSEPNLTFIQMTSSHQSSPSTKTSPRASLVAPLTTTISRRPSFRRPNLSGLNLMSLKHAIRKQLSPQQQPSSSSLISSTINSDLPSENIHQEDRTNRRWSLTSAPSSSGYGTTSPPSSQYSSFERLQHQQFICTCKQQVESNAYEDLPRLESRSLSMSLLDANLTTSPNKLLTTPDQDINTMAYIYKERYPKAKVQMEERLQNFIDTYKLVDKFEYCSDGSARFIHNQIVEIAKDCLEKSTNDLITSIYFYEMTDNLERLLLNAQEKCPQAILNLQTAVRKLLLTTARSARLLECLQFDPENFLRTLEEVEYQAKTLINLKQDIPKYICSKLNLERNPLDAIDGLQTNEEEKSSRKVSSSDIEIINDFNSLTITSNTPNSPIERSSSIKGPCEEDFDVLKLVSNGAYGAVHLVKHRQTEERYAMKKISKSHLLLRNQIEQVFVERDIMTFTDNPFVVALICTFETKNHLCLVMEYVEGGDVATLLKNIGGPLNIDIARMYFAETTLAVEYLHSYGIIHRDLKPDNLLITAVGHIKLTDFGLSKIGLMSLTTNFYEKLLDKETKTFNDKQICGTPTYIAPEVILRQGYGKPVDWWSMGIILYEFLVGIPPFSGSTPDELFANVINGEIDWEQFNSENEENDSSDDILCPDAKNLIEQLLEHDPSKRLGTLGGAYEIRTHSFCSCINWNSLLREKAEFVPVLESPDDTSYFDTRSDRYKHSDGDDDISSSTTNNDSDSLFASFSSVSLKYVSELSGVHKQRHSSRTENDSTSSADISRTNSYTDSINSNNVIQIDSPNDFQALSMSQSMIDEKTESSPLSQLPKFGSGTFEPTIPSSDESESSSSKKIHLSSTEKLNNIEEKKNTISSIKHSKQRKISLKLLEQQHCLDSGDENQQDKNFIQHHKKSRIPRALSPIKAKSVNLTTPTASLSNENVPILSSSSSFHHKPVLSNNLQQKNSRSLSKSFSSSSSSSTPSSSGIINQFARKDDFEHVKDDRSHRQTHRHNTVISPLERDTTLKTEQYSSSSLALIKGSLRPPIIIHRGPRSFGFTLRAVKVFHGDTDYYTTQHVIVAVEGPAEAAGLRPNDVITHVNDHPVAGLIHSEVVKLILSGSQTLSIRAIPCSETHIRIGGRRRSPSKQKLRYQHSAEKKSATQCQKHRINCPVNNSLTNMGTNMNKKHTQNNSLFRRLSERKVARDIEAAAAAGGGGISLPVPTTTFTNSPTQNPMNIDSANSNALSSSLPLLSFNQLTLDASEWPSLPVNEFDSSQQPTSLPLIVKQKSQPLMKHDQAVHSSLCKTISEPHRTSRQSNIPTNSNIYPPSCRTYPNQSYFSTPKIPASKRKLIRQKSIYVTAPSSTTQSSFTWDNNLNRNMYSYHSDSLPCETSSSIRSTNSSTKISYRRK